MLLNTVFKTFKVALSCSLMFFLSGCFGPFIPVVHVDEETAAGLRGRIEIVKPKDLGSYNYQEIGPVSATSCMNKIWDTPANKKDAINQLLFRTQVLGGNGITNILCEESQGTSLTTNCWNSLKCWGTAIKIQGKASKAKGTP